MGKQQKSIEKVWKGYDDGSKEVLKIHGQMTKIQGERMDRVLTKSEKARRNEEKVWSRYGESVNKH